MSESANRSTLSRAQYARHALKYGLVAGGLGASWMLLDGALGFQTDRVDIGRWTSLAAMVIPIASVILGLLSWRNHVLGGRIRFVQAFGMALAIGLVFSLMIGAGAFVQEAAVSPGIYAKKINLMAESILQRPGANAAEIETWREQHLAAATPASYAQNVFAQTLFQSLFVGLIAALSVPKKRPGLD